MGEYDDLIAAAGSPGPAAPTGGADDYGDLIAAAGGPVPEPSMWERAKNRVSSSFSNLGNTLKSGAGAAYEGLSHPIDTITNPARRREFERGVGDVVTFGLANRAARAVDPENFGPEAEQLDAEGAPGFRAAGNIGGMFLPSPASLAAARVAKAIPGTGMLANAARTTAAYEATAVPAAAIQAPSGHRLDAAFDAATDPAGLAVGLGASAIGGLASKVADKAADKLAETPGGKARRLIEERGGGARVGLATAGKGGVFDEELAGVPANDRGVGQAAKIGARQIHDTIEQQFIEENGFPYREGPAVVKEADRSLRDAKAAARSEARGIAIARRDDMNAARQAVKTETSERARKIIDDINENHKFETSMPYKALKSIIDSKPESIAPRDVTPIVTSMQDAVNDLETAPFVRGQLEEQLKILDRYRDKSGAVMVPERQLNGLRRTLMRAAKVGMNDAPGEAEAPLRKAAFVAKQMVDEGPYKELNDLYATGAAKREAARKAVGLSGKLPKDAALDQKRLVSGLRRSVGDETAIPGPAPEADVSDLRARLAEPDQAREDALAKVRNDLAKAQAERDLVAQRVAAGQRGAIPDRALLGLNDQIGTRKTDVNQTRLALERQVSESNTGGGNPADVETFRREHPELARAVDLAPLARAKADLTFHVKPHVGGLMDRVLGGAALPALVYGMATHPIATTLGLAAENRNPLAGRVMLPLADRLSSGASGANSAAIARLIFAAREPGITRAALQAQAEKDGIQPEIAANIAAQNGL